MTHEDSNDPRMDPRLQRRRWSRRALLGNAAAGLGSLALADLLRAEGQGGPRTRGEGARGQLEGLHHAPKVRRVIWMFMAGAPSQLELFEPKPTLQRLDGQVVPESFTHGKRFAFIEGDAKLMGTQRKFARHGECGAPVSELLPHTASIVDKLCFLRAMKTEEINHGPAKLFTNTGTAIFGRPSLGAWASYGLGSEATDLPGFVVLQSGPRGPRGGSPLYGAGFLPTRHQGVPFRSGAEPILHLSNPPGVDRPRQGNFIDAVNDLNRVRRAEVGDPEIDGRIAAYELAYRMQASAPDLVDLRDETRETLDLYGPDVERPSFARNCLLARRMVERGVRFVQLYHTDWDHHGDANLYLGEPLERSCREVDQASAALVLDLERRGLLEDTLVIWGGEFGRTPMSEVRVKVGRDHHIDAYTLWMTGGGIRQGHSHGVTDEIGYGPVSGRVHVHDLHATILHLLGVDHTRLVFRFQGRDFRLTDVAGDVVTEILS